MTVDEFTFNKEGRKLFLAFTTSEMSFMRYKTAQSTED